MSRINHIRNKTNEIQRLFNENKLKLGDGEKPQVNESMSGQAINKTTDGTIVPSVVLKKDELPETIEGAKKKALEKL